MVNCFRLIGYPPDYKGKREVVVAGNFIYDTGSVNLSNYGNPPIYGMMPMSMLTPRQHQQLLRMLEKTSIAEITGSANTSIVETTGSANIAGTSSLPILKWIIDTGASHHMIHDSRYLQHKDLIENAWKVQFPIGDSANVTHIGDCHIGGGDVL